MKNLYLTALLFFISLISFAQAPELMSYQALVRNADGDLIQDTSVGIRISILQNSDTGTAVYTETHTVTTNQNGLVTLSIGSGSSADDFSTIDWGNGSYYIKSETDPTGGTNYTIEGTSQLLSVPYALYAKNSGATGNGNNNPNSFNSNFLIADFNTIYAYNGSTETWSSQSASAVEGDDIVGSNGNFVVADFNTIYAYNGATGTWSSQSASAVQGGDIVGSNGNFVVADFNTIYAYNGATGTWSSQSASAVEGDDIVGSNGNFVIADFNTIYAYNGSTETWSSQSASAVQGGDIVGSNGNFVVADFNTIYAYNGATGTWSSQSASAVQAGDIVGSSANENGN